MCILYYYLCSCLILAIWSYNHKIVLHYYYCKEVFGDCWNGVNSLVMTNVTVTPFIFHVFSCTLQVFSSCSGNRDLHFLSLASMVTTWSYCWLVGICRLVLLCWLTKMQGSTLLTSSGHISSPTSHRGRHKMADGVLGSFTAENEACDSEGSTSRCLNCC